MDYPDGWLIHKANRGWYRPNAQGYTTRVSEAGRYSLQDAMAYSHPNGMNGPRDGMKIQHESEFAPPRGTKPMTPAQSVQEAIGDYIATLPIRDGKPFMSDAQAEYVAALEEAVRRLDWVEDIKRLAAVFDASMDTTPPTAEKE